MITTVTMNASVDKRYSVEMLEPGTVIRVRKCRNTAGGKGLNVTRTLSLLGAEVIAVGIVAGRNGDFIEGELTALGIDHDFSRARGESRCCINVVEDSGGAGARQTEFLEPGPEPDFRSLDDFWARFSRAASRSRVVAASGSLPAGAPSGFYRSLAKAAREAGAKVIVDSSGPSLLEALEGRPDLVKPNLDEAGAVLGTGLQTEMDAAGAAEELIRRGAGAAAVSMGARGVVAAGPEGVFHAAPPQVEPKTVVGCGDAMVAGFALGFDAGWGFARALKFAAALSAASAMCEETGGFRKADLEAVHPQVTVKSLK
ncbi:MAG: 1-phosphofructokinase family hexose kinase [Deltaproteobacteria bacterium]|jgi:tagatose 6-phosphate kinase|nr:1-phosphofructokinase family hexose kinase [Deltaproteobacteria bacterium]